MSTAMRDGTVLVPLGGVTVTRLTALRAILDDLLAELQAPPPAPSFVQLSAPKTFPTAAASGKHVAEVLGLRVAAPTMGLLLAAVVDLIAALDPQVLERLALMKARKRRFVSRRRDAIHPGRPDLPVVRARSGWWVSGNVSYAAACRVLEALCAAASLKFGEDVRFPAAGF